jgi:tetratricopeptide (TPR) repeat protein
VLEPAVAGSDKVLGSDHPYTLRLKNNLASTLREHGEAVRAEGLLRDLLTRYERVYGPSHSSTLIVINNLALALEEQDRFDEALVLHRSCLDRKAQAAGEDAPTTAISRLNLGKLLLELGKPDEGLPMVVRARAVLQAKYGMASKATIAAIDSEARGLDAVGRRAEAIDLLRAAMANADWPKVVPGVAWRIPGRLAKLLPADDATREAVVAQARELASRAGAVDALEAMLAPAP